MNIDAFDIAALPRIVFGPGRLQKLADIVAAYGRSVLVLTGGKSFRETAHWSALQTGLKRAGVQFADMTVTDEPSPQMIDNAVRHHHGRGIQAVVAIGGGSVLDAGKAIAGLLPFGNSVLDHLEGVGRGVAYTGPALPFIAVPTTAGTGSEATKNAVLSERGEGGYKKSFRHDTLVPRVALVDPDILASCPPPQIAANGMDALTQLLESYVSLEANPFTDALAWSGLTAVHDGFLDAWHGGDGEAARAGRAGMAYGALLSGITLAQVGLGSVHGLASPLGAFFPIPHGVVCGTLVAAATEVNIRVLKDREPDSPALSKYAQVGRLFAGDGNLDDNAAHAALVERLADWTTRMEIPHLGAYGVKQTHVARVVTGCRGSSMKTNPIVLTDEEVGEVVKKRL